MEYSEITNYAKNILKNAGHDERYEIIITDIVLLVLYTGRTGINGLLVENDETVEKIFKIIKRKIYDKDEKDIAPLIMILELNGVSISTIKGLLKYITSFNDEMLQEYLDYMINEKLPSIFQGQASINWINNLVIKLMSDVENKELLINMDSGYGKFLFDAKKMNIALKYIGWTINYEESVIGNYYKSIKYKKKDDEIDVAIWININPSEFHSKVDMIYTTYPFKSKIRNYLYADWWESNDGFPLYSEKYSANMAALINGINLLSKDGILIALIPDGGLFNIPDRDIRRYLTEKNYLDTIIFLPGGIIPSTGVTCSLLIVKKNRESKQNIKMINARDLYERKRRHSEFSMENIEQIYEWYKSNEINENVLSVSKEEIIEQDYNFALTRYLKKRILKNAVALGSISKKTFRGYQVTAKELDKIVALDESETQYYVVNVSDIQPEGYITSDLQRIKSDAGNKLSKYYLEEGDLIITAKNSIVKSAVYRADNNKKVILTGNLIVIRLDKSKCDPYYLQAFLNSEDGENEIKSIQTGTTIRVINPKGLEEMLVPLKTMEDQKKIATLYEKTIQEIQDLKNTLNMKTESLGTIYER